MMTKLKSWKYLGIVSKIKYWLQKKLKRYLKKREREKEREREVLIDICFNKEIVQMLIIDLKIYI